MGLVVLFITGGCVSYQASIKPPIGAICNFKAPLTTDFHNTDVGMATKKASIKKTYYFHDILFTGIDLAWGTADIPEIASKAGIKNVTYADYEFLNILGIYAEFGINVYGY